MDPHPPPRDALARALDALRATPGPDAPPADVLDRVRRQIAEQQARPPVRRPRWLPRLQLAAAVLLLAAAGTVVGYHRQLLSGVAGRYTTPDGAVALVYTDGRVERQAGGPSR
jgi:hypothetical protein